MNSKHISYSFRHLASIFLLLVCGTIGATAQGLRGDSIFADTEMEDSLSSLAIKPVEDTQKLLKQCLKRLKKDLGRYHSQRQYMFKGIHHNTVKYPSLTISRVGSIEYDNGITLDKGIEWSPSQVKAQYPLDKEDIRYLEDNTYLNCMPRSLFLSHSERVGWGYPNWSVNSTTYRELMNFYDIEAYSISDDSGRGVYRIDLVQKEIEVKETDRGKGNLSFLIRLYFDLNSLRLIQNKGGTVTRSGLRKFYKQEYGVEDGSPVLIHSKNIIMRGQETLSTYTIQLIKAK